MHNNDCARKAMQNKNNIENKNIIGKFDALQSSLLPILHEIMHSNGKICEDDIRNIATHLNLSRAEVWGVVSFYSDFKNEDSKTHIQICNGEACQAQNSEKIANEYLNQNGLEWGENSNGILVEKIFCLGLCSRGPAAMKDGQLIANFGGDE